VELDLSVSLVIPVYNETDTIEALFKSIVRQSFLPAEVIIVDAGSTDDTVSKAKKLIASENIFSIIEAGRAMPGEARNFGAAHSINEWIAFTDAGILLNPDWLENLVKKIVENPKATIVYGNYSPQIHSLFDKCATMAFVPPLQEKKIRGKSIVSCLLKKEIWTEAGGFPAWRAAEDLIFMEKAEAVSNLVTTAPDAMAMWELPPGFRATYRKFKLYSTHNVWAGRQAHWHYGVARQYAFLLIPVSLAIFQSAYWLILIPVWIAARTFKRMIVHRYQFGSKIFINPLIFLTVMMIILTIDTATFTGWINAKIITNSKHN